MQIHLFNRSLRESCDLQARPLGGTLIVPATSSKSKAVAPAPGERPAKKRKAATTAQPTPLGVRT